MQRKKRKADTFDSFKDIYIQYAQLRSARYKTVEIIACDQAPLRMTAPFLRNICVSNCHHCKRIQSMVFLNSIDMVTNATPSALSFRLVFVWQAHLPSLPCSVTYLDFCLEKTHARQTIQPRYNDNVLKRWRFTNFLLFLHPARSESAVSALFAFHMPFSTQNI